MNRPYDEIFKVGGGSKPAWRCYINFLLLWDLERSKLDKKVKSAGSRVSSSQFRTLNPTGIQVFWILIVPQVQVHACSHGVCAWPGCSRLSAPNVSSASFFNHLDVPESVLIFSQPSSTSPSPIPHFFPLLVSDCVHCSTRLCLALRSTVKSHKWCITHSTQHCPRNRLDLCMTACPDPQYPPPGTVLIYNASHTDQGSCVNVKQDRFFSVIYGRKTKLSLWAVPVWFWNSQCVLKSAESKNLPIVAQLAQFAVQLVVWTESAGHHYMMEYGQHMIFGLRWAGASWLAYYLQIYVVTSVISSHSVDDSVTFSPRLQNVFLGGAEK